ncbi:MAG: GTPase Era [Thermoleophilia bacterium]|nr:GTPase Era [Thermoleophilia bacterium]
MNNENEPAFRSGFIAVVGRPNVGKSTIVNALVGEKVAIVSRTPQTTRHRIAGVVNRPGYQLVLLDLPGFQKPRDLLTERMQTAVNTTLQEVDIVLLVLNAAEKIGLGDRFVAEAAFTASEQVIIAINKIDLVRGPEVLPMMQEASQLGEFQEIIPISALRNRGLDDLEKAMTRRVPAGPAYFPPGTVSDQPERVIAGELIREKAIELTREEVPHAIAVDIVSMKKRRRRDIVDIEAVLIVERDSQKGIIIGRRGQMVREIGARARQEIEALLGSRVFLDLTVKVRRKWREDERILGDLGL